MPSQRGFTSEGGSKGDRDPNILVSSDGLKLSMLEIVKKVLALELRDAPAVYFQGLSNR